LPRASANGVKEDENPGLPTFEDLRPQFLKIPLDLWVPDEFEEFEIAWHIRLLKASLRSDLLGYVPVCKTGCRGCSGCLDRLSGSRRKDFWDAKSRCLMARWQMGEIGGRQVWYFPPLVACLVEQLKHLRMKKKKLGGVVGKSRRFSSPSTSQSSLDFDSSNQTQKKSSARARETVGKYSKSDYEARDIRRMKEANDKLDRICQASVGNIPKWVEDEKKVFEWICLQAGITVERGLELEQIQKKWPEKSKTLAAAI
jgi:hypothetical protein